MIKPNMIYSWEMETVDKEVLKQYEPDGKENTWKNLPIDQIVRVSFVSSITFLPSHNIIINRDKGIRFIRRFGRGFIKQKEGGFKLSEYVNCVVTNKFRVYVFSNGSTLVTDPDYELYL